MMIYLVEQCYVSVAVAHLLPVVWIWLIWRCVVWKDLTRIEVAVSCWCGGRECSRVVLGIEFHHLANDDLYKVALKDTIVAAREQLATYTICHVFHILDWLLVNQWSHPTLVAMMRGEDVDRDCGNTLLVSHNYACLYIFFCIPYSPWM